MILIIRGHIRDSFDSPDLYSLVQYLYYSYSNVRIYIHTWDVFANNVSWRHIHENNTKVTKDVIYSYFRDYANLIEEIIIENDSEIQLKGNLEGNINGGPAPVKGWKNYWYGKYKILDHISSKNIDKNEMIVNFRFDLFTNSNPLDIRSAIWFIGENINKQFSKNVFIIDGEHHGIDNIYIGNITTMCKLTYIFHNLLDTVLACNPDTINQEHLVVRINNILLNDLSTIPTFIKTT